ncbi:3'-5' exonuclease [Sporobolomyces salmoneus]|uniref:3'-5' exonuclease n=1 Tax=Sporobolomyces salmoneus TaxID=183962 RepID=UPI003170725E
MSPAPTVAELRSLLSSLSLDSRGTKSTLKHRLLKHKQSSSTTSSASPSPPANTERRRPKGQKYDSYLVCDVEATCENIQGNPKLAFSYPNEIIEWPVILLQWRRRKIESRNPLLDEHVQEEGEEEWELYEVDEFHSFVKPTWAPELSEFCTELTGITQDQVDSAPTFQEVLKKFEKEFITKHELFTKSNQTIWITDGPWDLRDFIAKTLYLSQFEGPRPDYLAGEIIDLKLLVSNFFAEIKVKKDQQERGGKGIENGSSSLTSTSTVQIDDDSLPPTPGGFPSDAPPTPPLTAVKTPSISPSCPAYQPSSLLLSPPPDLTLPSVLLSLTLPPFLGRAHSGLSDARNISRIILHLANDRQLELKGNRIVPDGGKGGKERRWGWMGKKGVVKWEGCRKWLEERMEQKEKERLNGVKGNGESPPSR